MFLALHVPDGFIDGPTSAAAAGITVGSVGVALRVARRRLLDESLALAGLVAAFVFAAQMVNFPVAAGTSGHLIGAALAAVLVGPASAIVILSSVMVVQSLLFADGGLTALGINVLNMGVLAPLGAWLLFRLILTLAGRRRSAVIPATAVAAWASVVVASLGFTAQYALGGYGSAPVDTVLAAMVGVHSLIGIGEAFITVIVVRAILSTRPDLVREARGAATVTTVRRPIGVRAVVIGGLVVLAVAVGASQLGSGDPDGLERVAIDTGFDETATDHALASGALADYGDDTTGTATSGITGAAAVLAVTLAALGAVGGVLRRRTAPCDPPARITDEV